MPSIKYDQVYSRFYTKVQAYDLIYNNMSDELVQKILCSYLHSSVYYPMIRNLFDSVSMDDEQKTIEYTMSYSVDDETDKQFIADLLGAEMGVKWLTPKVANLSNVVQYFGTSESKYYSQANQLSELRSLKTQLEDEVRSLIADRGIHSNTFLDGSESTFVMRSEVSE